MDRVPRTPVTTPVKPSCADISQRFHRGYNHVERFSVLVGGEPWRGDGIPGLAGQKTIVQSPLLRTCTDCGGDAGLQARTARSIDQRTSCINEFRNEFIKRTTHFKP